MMRHLTPIACSFFVGVLFFATAAKPVQAEMVPIGVAKMDVTPEHPVRLVGYASRTNESEGVAGRLWAKAMAIGSDEGDGPAILLTVDNCGVPDNVTEEVAKRLKEKADVQRERFMVCSTHTHTGPWLDGYLPWHYVEPLPESHKDHIRRYTRTLTDAMERVALDALANRQPGKLSWAQGKVGFAVNRRLIKDGKWAGFGVMQGGAVDHSLPILCASDGQGKLRAVVVNYACHCTTLTGQHNRVHGDWAGLAQEFIERQHPDVVAMVTIGCGGDANPEPRGDADAAQQNGLAVASEVARLLKGQRVPVDASLEARMERIKLPFGDLPSREELAERAKTAGRVGDFAQSLIKQMDSTGALPQELDYSVGVWSLGDDLAMVFLAGEVVVDYALRLKRELDGDRLWITAYANDVPCYIASKRLLPEGGYEVDSSMVSYGQPTRLAPEAEDRIIDTVRKLIPSEFKP